MLKLVTCRSKDQDIDYLSSAPFVLPQKVFTGKPAAQPRDSGVLGPIEPSKAAPIDPLDDLFGPAVPVPGSEFLAGTGLETLDAPAMDYGSKFGSPFPLSLAFISRQWYLHLSPCHLKHLHEDTQTQMSLTSESRVYDCMIEVMARPIAWHHPFPN